MKKYFIILFLILLCGPAFAGTTILVATPGEKEKASSLAQRGREEFHSGNPEKAFQLFQEALNYDPACVDAHSGYGQILLQAGKRKEAINSFKKVLQFSEDPGTRRAAKDFILKVKTAGAFRGVFFVLLYSSFGLFVFKRNLIHKNLAIIFYIMAGIECVKIFQLLIY